MNKLKKTLSIFIIVCYSFFNVIIAQDEDSEVTKLKFTPPTPEVAALGKYIETPVSLFTGIPQISIPIYEIQQKRFSVPVSLSYHAGGIKVEEVASRTGMGWTLNGGGMITRTMKMLPDDSGPGYLNTQYTVANIYDRFPLESTNGQSLLMGIKSNTIDFEPDIFSFSFAGYSGSFYFDQETKLPVFQDYIPLKIEPVYKNENQFITDTHGELTSVDHKFAILAFIITTPEGIQYHFGKAKDTEDYATQIRGNSEIDIRYIGLENAGGAVESLEQNERSYISTWYLKEIYDPISEQSVYYNYTTENPIQLTRTSEEHVIYEELPAEGNPAPTGNCASFPPRDQFQKHFLTTSAKNYLIKEIIFDQGKIEFINDDKDRLDLPLARALTEIEVTNNNNKIIKSFGLNHFYTTATRFGYEFRLDNFFPIDYESGFKRLFLQNVKEYEINSNNTVNRDNYKTFGFEYSSPEELPHRMSAMQDYWGYYNGAFGNKNLMPDQVYIYTAPDGRRIIKNIGEADRSVSTETSKYGTLSKITYPTGGSKTFVYENNMTYTSVEGNPYEWVHNYFDYQDINAQTTLPAPDYLEYEWTIDIDIAQIIDFNINAPCNSSEDEFDTCPWLINFTSISDSDGLDAIWTHTKTVSRYVQPGTYRIKVTYGEHNNGPPDFGPNGDIFELNFRTLQYIVPVEEIELTPAGGLRIKEIITDDDGDNDIENRRFEYLMENGSPSGFFAGQIPYYQDQVTEIRCLDKVYPQAAPPRVIRINKANLRSYRSVSTIPLTQTSGSYFGNRRVTEYIGSQEIGKTVHEFAMKSDRFAAFPAAHIEDYSFLRGKPLSTTVFRNDNGGFIEEQKTEYGYTEVNRESQKAYAFSVNSYEDLLDFDNNGSLDNIITFHAEYTDYELKSRWYKLDNIVKTTYDPETNESIKDSTVYRYNSNTLNRTRISRYINSYSDRFTYQTISNYYPDDIDALSSFNIPDEQRSLIETLNKANQNRLGELVFSRRIESLESTKTVRFKEYDGNKVLPEYTEIFKEGYGTYITGKVLQYDDDLNPIEVQEKENSPITSYIWGYQGQYPIAVLQNIVYDDIPTTTITTLKNLSDADDDRCTENTCAEQELREALNTLSNDFPNGMVTTFTYDPLIGTTSATDPKGYTSYYVYDGYNRLQYIKDAEGNVLQEYEYNYKNQ